MFKTKQILGVTGAALTLSALALPSTAGIISVGTTAPTGDGADQFNLVARTAGASIFGDRPVQGQTFTTTADSGQELVSLTVSLRDNTGLVFDGWKDYLIRFGTITSGTLTPIHEEVIRQNDDLAASTDIYHTFTFDAPIALS
ncbi:MAG: hypothetical protein AB8C95_15520, partial [Phycisphaeraceae bacterium]